MDIFAVIKQINMNDNKKEIIELLRSIKRPGMENVITWLDTAPSFFVASGARIHHDNVEGGLAYHSLKVYKLAKAEWEKRDAAFKQEYPLESVTISALLHDVCKKDVYYIDADGNPTWNEENHRKGHGLRSHPMSAWPFGGIWAQETRCRNPTIPRNMPSP